MKQIFFVLLFISVECIAQISAPIVDLPQYKSGWNVVLADEFNGTTIDASKWWVRCGWTNNNIDVVAQENAYISDGKLVIKADYVPGNYADCGGQPGQKYSYFKTGSLTSFANFGPGSYMEIRAKLPKGKYYHVGFFTYVCNQPNDVAPTSRHVCNDVLAWPDAPTCKWSEIDIWEHPTCEDGHLRNFHSNYHWVAPGTDFKYECPNYQDVSTTQPDFNQDWYTIAVYWETNSIKWYINNKLVREVTNNIPQVAAPLWLGVSVDTPNNPNSTTAQELLDMVNSPGYDNTMEIDYVRVYKTKCAIKNSIDNYGITQGYNNQNERPRILADVNGDGRKDILTYAWTTSMVSYGNSNGLFGTNQYILNDYTKEQGYTDMNTFPRIACDINGDLKSDIIGLKNGVFYGSLSTSSSTVASFTNPNSIVTTILNSNTYQNQSTTPIVAGDFNNDGKQDIVYFGSITKAMLSNTTTSASSVSFIAPATVTGFNSSTTWPSQDQTPRLIGDVNGDGKDDIIGFGQLGTYVSFSNSTTSTISFTTPQLVLSEFGINQGWPTQETRPRLIADVNGDGYDDIVGFGWTFVLVSFGNSTGFGSAQYVLANFTQEQGWSTLNDYPRTVADVNSDGKADIIGFGDTDVKISISKSTTSSASFYESQNVVNDFTKSKGWTNQNLYPRFVADITGNGINDIVGFSDDKVLSLTCLNSSGSLREDENNATAIDATNHTNNSVETTQVSIYPNPSSGEVNIANVNYDIYNTIEVYNNMGTLVHTQKIIESSFKFTINSSGIYNVIFRGDSQKTVSKIIVQ